MKKHNHTTRRFLNYLVCVFLFAMAAASCSDSPFNPAGNEKPPTPPGGGQTFGLVEVTISGIGTDNMSASVRPAGSNTAADFTRPGTGSVHTIQTKPVSNGSFTYDGFRYIFAVFEVRNADASGATAYTDIRQNLTFLAVDTEASASVGETYGNSAASQLLRFNGQEPANATQIAESMIPTGRVVLSNAGALTALGPDVLQVFTESEVQAFENTLGGTEVHDIFPYGFMVRSLTVTPNSRDLPASPASDEFDGRVTFAFKIPLQAQANQDPFEISMMFLPVDDGQTRITRSVEEALYGVPGLFEQRATLVGAATVTLLGNTAYNGIPTARTICNARVSGPVGAPVSTLSTTEGCSADLFRYYVDADATGSNNGSSWNDAFTDLQSALAVAGPDDEIWIAEGTYYPTSVTDKTISFKITGAQDGLDIYGGFNPATGADTFADRDPSVNKTILSGDLGENDSDGDSDGFSETNRGDNSYHVFYLDGLTNPITSETTIDGITISGGNAVSSSVTLDNSGGGLVCVGQGSMCNPVLQNVTFADNNAIKLGGALYNIGDNGESSPAISNSLFKNNRAGFGGGTGGSGGAIYNNGFQGISSPVIKNTVFIGNKSIFNGFDGNGGAIYNDGNGGDSSPVLINVVFANNHAGRDGGAVFNDARHGGKSSPKVINTVFGNNSSGYNAGAFYSIAGGAGGVSSPEIINVTFFGNDGGITAPTGADGGAMVNDADNGGSVTTTITNSIFYGNSASNGGQQIYNRVISAGATVSITIGYSLIDTTNGGVTNADGASISYGSTILTGNPAFTNSANLIGADNSWATDDDGLRLDSGSPALDAGDDSALLKDIVDLDGDSNTTETISVDLTLRPRLVNGTIDWGAYERQ